MTMPELPEVETIVRVLETSLKGSQIQSMDFRYPGLLEEGSEFPLEFLVGKTITDFSRRGKYLVFEFDHAYAWIVHLRMEGKFHLYEAPQRPTKHTHLVLECDDHTVHYLDTRKFSRMAVVSDVDAYFIAKKLGPEPFGIDPEYLYKQIKKSTRAIKNILLDQSVVVGIGNIYADEILFETQIHPLTKGNKITKKDVANLVVVIESVLSSAIEQGGTTIRSYTSSLNVNGRFQVRLNAYGQAGKPCTRCGNTLSRIVLGGRSTVFCSQCQKVKR